MITFTDLRTAAAHDAAQGITTPRGIGLAQDALGLREYSGDRGVVPAPALASGHVDIAPARVFNAYYRGEFDPLPVNGQEA